MFELLALVGVPFFIIASSIIQIITKTTQYNSVVAIASASYAFIFLCLILFLKFIKGKDRAATILSLVSLIVFALGIGAFAIVARYFYLDEVFRALPLIPLVCLCLGAIALILSCVNRFNLFLRKLSGFAGCLLIIGAYVYFIICYSAIYLIISNACICLSAICAGYLIYTFEE